MNALEHKVVCISPVVPLSGVGGPAWKRSAVAFAVHRRPKAQAAGPSANWDRRSEQWGCLMAAAQGGERQAYEQLLRELDGWLRRYYARRLPGAAAEDARQDALLAIHAKRHAYAPSRPFGPWVAAIARYKWIDQIREAARFSTLPLHDDIPVGDHVDAATSTVMVDGLLKQLKPGQALAIRLVKLQDLSIEAASVASGQSAALVKVNIHRGLKKLAAMAARDAVPPSVSDNSSMPQKFCANRDRASSPSGHRSSKS
jgi:RNA polymerase sigma factor (sigma-70 family)